MAVRTVLKQPEEIPGETQVKGDGLAISVERRSASSGIALRHLRGPQLHVCL